MSFNTIKGTGNIMMVLKFDKLPRQECGKNISCNAFKKDAWNFV